MCHQEELGARLRWSVLYSLFVAGVIAPIYLVIIVEFFRPEFSREHSLGTLAVGGYSNGISEFFLMVLVRTGEWIERGATLFSLPGLAMGLVGLILMARRQTLYLPLAIAIVHFGVSIFMPLFGGAYLRTHQYLMPFLVLGAAYLGWYLFNVSRGRHNKHLIRYVGLVVVAISATWHFFIQTQVLTDVRLLTERAPAAWDMYYQGQRQLRPVISDIQTLMPREAILISWGYGPQFLYTNLTEPSQRRVMLPAFSALWLRLKNNKLKTHIKNRRLLLKSAPLYFLFAPGTDGITEADVKSRVLRVLGAEGFAVKGDVGFDTLKRWPIDGSWPKDLVLFQLRS